MVLLLDLLMSRNLWAEAHPVASCAPDCRHGAYRWMHLYSRRPAVFPAAGKCIDREKDSRSLRVERRVCAFAEVGALESIGQIGFVGPRLEHDRAARERIDAIDHGQRLLDQLLDQQNRSARSAQLRDRGE